jgi:hypothetical protein
MAKRVGACLVWVLAVENTLARDCDSINVSQKAPLGLQVVAFQFNLDVRVTSAYPLIVLQKSAGTWSTCQSEQ